MENENISTTELLTTSDSAFSKTAGYRMNTYEKEEGDIDGPFALAVAASETLDDGIYSDVVWISSTSLLDEQTNEMVSGGNPFRRSPTMLNPRTPPLRPSPIMNGGRSTEIAETPLRTAIRPTRQN